MARNFYRILLDREDSLVSDHEKISRSPKDSMVLQQNTSAELGKQNNYRFDSDFNKYFFFFNQQFITRHAQADCGSYFCNYVQKKHTTGKIRREKMKKKRKEKNRQE